MESDRKLALAISISLVLHFFILILAAEYAPWKILKAGKKSPLVIQLNDLSSEKRTEQYSRNKQHEKKTEAKEIVSVKKVVTKDQLPEKEKIEELQPPPDELKPQESLSNQPLVRDKNIGDLLNEVQNQGTGDWQTEYSKKLRDIIKENQRYPVMAMRNHLQGTVMVGFILHRSGKLLECHVTQSCGHQILDRAALRAVSIGEPYPSFPEDLGLSQAGFIIPVTFSIGH